MNPQKILVVEEDRETNQVFSISLQKLGYIPDFSREQAEILLKIECINYAVIFLNPCPFNWDLGKIFRKLSDTSHQASLILMADFKDKDRLSSFCYPATVCCLYKPVNCQEISLALQRTFEVQELKEQINNLKAKLEIFKDPDHFVYFSPNDQGNMTIEDVFEKKLEIFVKKMSMLDKCNLFDIVFDRLEKRLMEMVLKETAGNQIRAAGILGISRNTLRKKMKGK